MSHTLVPRIAAEAGNRKSIRARDGEMVNDYKETMSSGHAGQLNPLTQEF